MGRLWQTCPNNAIVQVLMGSIRVVLIVDIISLVILLRREVILDREAVSWLMATDKFKTVALLLVRRVAVRSVMPVKIYPLETLVATKAQYVWSLVSCHW